MATNRNEYKNKYLKDNYDRVLLCLDKGDKDRIKEYADSCGESVNSFIKRAIKETVERDKKSRKSNSFIGDTWEDLYKALNENIASIAYSLLKDNVSYSIKTGRFKIDYDNLIKNEPMPERRERSMYISLLDFLKTDFPERIEELENYVDPNYIDTEEVEKYAEAHSIDLDAETDDDYDIEDTIVFTIILERIHHLEEIAKKGEMYFDLIG